MTTEINPQSVKQLREKTNAGMMDCKRALAEANGNMEKAESILRTKGIASASKKSTRQAKEGIVAAYIHLQGKVGVLVGQDAMLGALVMLRRTAGDFPASSFVEDDLFGRHGCESKKVGDGRAGLADDAENVVFADEHVFFVIELHLGPGEVRD